jgi:pimeloyl-[acyl-carrier protein] synthase
VSDQGRLGAPEPALGTNHWKLGVPEVELLRPSSGANPYPIYSEIRKRGSIYRSEFGYWIVTGYEQTLGLIDDPRIGVLTNLSMRPDARGDRYPTLERFHRQWVLFAGKSTHASLRNALSLAISPEFKRVMETTLPVAVARYINAVDWTRPFDFVGKIARPLAMEVLGEALGVPRQDRERLGQLTVCMSEVLEPFLSHHRLSRAEHAAQQIEAMIEGWTLQAATDGSGLRASSAFTGDDGVANAALLAAAGHETTANLISMGAYELLRRPDALEYLARRPDDVGRAVEELARFTSPIQLVARTASRDFAAWNCKFDAGDVIIFILGAANRDPERFDVPDELVLDRERNSHLAFGAGPHQCFGSALARTEARALFGQILPLLSAMRLAPDPVRWSRKRTVRGLDALNLEPIRQ